MINNTKIISKISQQYKTIRQLCTDNQRTYMVNGMVLSESRESKSYNLPFVLAYSVLDQALTELVNQKTIQCKGKIPQLEKKMKESKKTPKFKWRNYDKVNEGRMKRNDIAYKGKLLDKKKCLEYIDAIETELKVWKIL